MEKKTKSVKSAQKEEEQMKIALTPEEAEKLAVENLYKQVEMDTKDIKRFLSFFKQADKRIRALSSLCYSDLEGDLETVGELPEGEFFEEENEISSEDAIFDLMNEQYDLVQKLILAAAKYINSGL